MHRLCKRAVFTNESNVSQPKPLPSVLRLTNAPDASERLAGQGLRARTMDDFAVGLEDRAVARAVPGAVD